VVPVVGENYEISGGNTIFDSTAVGGFAFVGAGFGAPTGSGAR